MRYTSLLALGLASLVCGLPCSARAVCDFYPTDDPRYDASDCVPPDATLTESPDIVSPPTLVGPGYECQTSLGVTGFVTGATLRIYIKNLSPPHAVWATGAGSMPLEARLTGAALTEGAVLFATQQVGSGAESAPSNEITVEALPNPLPEPSIQPFPVYECGRVIAVRNVIPGSAYHVDIDDYNLPETRFVDAVALGPWTAEPIEPLPLFGDIDPELNQMRAQYSICGQSSALSEPEPIVSAGHVNPPPIPLPTPELYEGQTFVRIRDAIFGSLLEIRSGTEVVGSLPTWWWGPRDTSLVPLGRPLSSGETIHAMQTLCDSSDSSDPIEVQSCSELPPPRLKIPQAGDDEVTVEEAIPGARILVFAIDGANEEEIGDGSGDRIRLTRRVGLGEMLRAVQVLDGCGASWAQSIVVPCRRFGEYAMRESGPFEVAHVDVTRNAGLRLEWDSITADAVSRVYFPEHPVLGGILRSGGRRPIVFVMHGNDQPISCPSTGEVCGAPCFSRYCGRLAWEACSHEWWLDPERPNHAAFESVATALASHGFIVVGINANEICSGGSGNIAERADLFRIHMYLASQGDLDPIVPGLSSQADWSRVLIVGHSRAGEAAVAVANVVGVSGVVVRGVVALAPTDLLTIGSPSVPVLVVTGTRDNDTGPRGNAIYDRSAGATLRSLISIRGANHAFYTDIWPDEASGEGGQNPLSRAAQTALTREILLGFANRSFDLDSSFDRVLEGEQGIDGFDLATLRTTPLMQPLSTYESGNFSSNDIGGSTTVDPTFAEAEIDWCSDGEGLQPVAFMGASRVLWLRWTSNDRTVEESIPGGFPDTRRWLSFRAALVPAMGSSVASMPLSIDVTVSDGMSLSRTIDSADAGYVPGAYGGFNYTPGGDFHPAGTFARWGSVRIPLACILGDAIPADAVRAVTLKFGDRPEARAAIDDFMLE